MLRVSPFRLLCGVGFFAIFSSTMAKSPVLPLFADYLGATESDIGFIAAAATVVGIVVSLPAGALSDLWGRRRVIMLAMAVFATAPFLYLLVSDVPQFVAIRVYHGFATAIFGPVALAYVADLFSKERGEKMGWYSSATLAGRSVAPFVGGTLLGLFTLGAITGYRLVYIVCGVGGCLALIASLFLPVLEGAAPTARASTAEKWRETKRGLWEVLSHIGILFTSFAEAAQYFAYGAMETFLPLYALREGLNAYEIGVLLGLQVVIVAFTKPLMGRFSDSHGRHGQIMAGMWLGAAGMVLLPFTHSFWAMLPISIGFGLSMSTVTASTAALVSDLARKGSYGAALGTMSTIMDMGHASGPAVTGMLIASLGYRSSFLAVGVALAAISLVFRIVVRPQRSADGPSPS